MVGWYILVAVCLYGLYIQYRVIVNEYNRIFNKYDFANVNKTFPIVNRVIVNIIDPPPRQAQRYIQPVLYASYNRRCLVI